MRPNVCIFNEKTITGSFIFIISTLFSSYALAASCTSYSTSSVTESLGTVTVTPGTAIGQALMADKTFSNVNFAKCEASFTFSKTYNVAYKGVNSVAGTYNGRTTFKTNVNGIGIQLGGTATVSGGQSGSASGWIASGATSKTYFNGWNIGWGSVMTIAFQPAMNVIKLSDTVSSGTLSGKVGQASAVGNEHSAYLDVNLGGTVVSSGCKVNGGSDQTIALGDAMSSQFPSVGSTSNAKAFSIALNCNAGTKVNMTITGTNVSSGTAGTLANNGTAKGIGVQILSNNLPVVLGTSFTAITSAQANDQINLNGQFIRTGDITAGSVNANATYTLNYE